MAPRGRPAKNEFQDLAPEFKEIVEGMSDDEIKFQMAKVSVDEHENRANKKNDQDLEEKKAVYSQAGAIYKEATKANKLKISYCYHILESRGKL